jgi:hypothetical protein
MTATALITYWSSQAHPPQRHCDVHAMCSDAHPGRETNPVHGVYQCTVSVGVDHLNCAVEVQAAPVRHSLGQPITDSVSRST